MVSMARPVGAQEEGPEPPAHPAVKGFVDNIYDLQRMGLKDLSVVLDTPIFRGSSLFKHIKVMVYCKTPDRHSLDIVGLPEETRLVFLEQLKPIATLTRYLFGLGSILVKVLDQSSIEVTREEGLFKIVATPETDALKKDFTKMTLWVSEDSRPVRIVQESPELGKLEVGMTVVRVDKKFLVSALKVKGVKGIDGEIRMKIKYEKREKYQLPKTVTMRIGKDDGEEEPQEFHFKDYKLNKGLKDSLFEKSKTPEDEEDGY
jgi:outer membrane lipoprotein-sorting protein